MIIETMTVTLLSDTATRKKYRVRRKIFRNKRWCLASVNHDHHLTISLHFEHLKQYIPQNMTIQLFSFLQLMISREGTRNLKKPSPPCPLRKRSSVLFSFEYSFLLEDREEGRLSKRRFRKVDNDTSSPK